MRKPLVLLTLLTSACAHAPAPSTPDDAFDALAREYLGAYHAAHPIQATALGIHAHDDQMPRLDAASIASRSQAVRAALTRLEAIDATRLERQRQFDLQILIRAAKAELLEREEVRSWQRNPMRYNALVARGAATLVDRTFAPLPVRVRALTQRLKQVPRIMAEARANLKDVPALWIDLAVKSTRGTLAFLAADLPAALAAQGREEFTEELTSALDAAVATATTELELYVTWLTEDLKARPPGDPALGRDLFERKLRFEEHIDVNVDDLEKMNEEAIAFYQGWVAREAKRVDPDADPREVMRSITEQFPSAGTLLETAEAYVLQARDLVKSKDLVTLPSDRLPVVRESPPYMRRGFASMSTPGPYEREADEAYYNITNVDPDWWPQQQLEHLTYFNFPGLLGISVHEVMPGHFVQLLYEEKITSDVRKVFGTGAVVEGWAHYAEQMMVDEGLGGGDPAVRLGQLRRALQRHARWYAAIAIHVRGVSVEAAARRFQEIAYFARFPALRETRRATFNPTYLYYAYGRMKILELRDLYAERQGEAYSLKAFHDHFLTLGLPLSLAREALIEQ